MKAINLRQPLIMTIAAGIMAVIVAYLAFSPWDRDFRLRSWEKCRLKAEELFIKGKTPQARTKYYQAIDQAKQLDSEGYYSGISYLGLADFYLAKHQYKPAQEYYKKSLVCLEKYLSLKPLSPTEKKLVLQDVARLKAGLADTYLYEHKWALAERLYRESVEQLSAWPGKELNSYEDNLLGQSAARSLYMLGVICKQTGRLSESINYHRRSLTTARKSATATNLVERIADDYEDLLKTTGQEDSNLRADKRWLSYRLQSEYCQTNSDWNQAEIWEDKALAEAKKADQSKLHLAVSLKSLGRIYYSQGRYKEAEKFCFMALAITESLSSSRNELTDGLYSRLINIYAATGNMVGAEPIIQRLLDLRLKQYGPNHPKVAQCYVYLADAYQFNGKYDLAKITAKQAFIILQKMGGRKRKVMSEIQQLGRVLIEQKNILMAQTLIETTLNITNNTDTKSLVCKALMQWELYYLKIAQHQDPTAVRKAAQKSVAELPVDKQIRLGSDFSGWGKTFAQHGDQLAADVFYEAAFEIFERMPKESKNEALYAIKSYADILREEGRAQQAQQVLEKSNRF